MKAKFSALLVGCLALVACQGPEATRTRGGGPGADPGNRPATVRMHEGSDQYWRTPQRIQVKHPPLEPARQAREARRP